MIDNAYHNGKIWRIKCSPSKTKCIVFSGKRGHPKNNVHFQRYLGNQVIEKYSYLGIILSADGSSKTRTKAGIRKSDCSLGALKATGFHSNYLSLVTCSTLWHPMTKRLLPSL